MQVIITARGADLTDALRDYVEEKIGGLTKFFDQIIRADVVLGLQTRHHQKGDIFFAECKLEVPGKDVFVKEDGDNVYKAIDKARESLGAELKKIKVLRREKSKKARKFIRERKSYEI